jgi:hypothetical protein
VAAFVFRDESPDNAFEIDLQSISSHPRMRAVCKSFLFLAGGSPALLLTAAPAVSAPATFSASVSLVIATLPPPTLHGSGVGDITPGGAISIPAGLSSGNPAIVVPISPTFVGLFNVTVPANSIDNPAATFDPGGAMGLSGSAFFNDGAGGTIPLFPVGGGGIAVANIRGIPITLVGATWQGVAPGSGGKVFTGMGAALANVISATATAFDNRDPDGFGTVQLVAPAYALISNGALGNLPVFGVFTLTHTPEAGTLLFLGAGIVALTTIGRAKRDR